jgi:hypothetical protein
VSEPGGRTSTVVERTWSPRAAWRAAGVPDRVCRRAVDQGFVPKKRLRGEHLVVLRMLAYIEHFPGSVSPTPPELLTERNRIASRLVEECWYQGDVDWALLVTALDARLVRDPAMAGVLLNAFRDKPLLLLPIGIWRQEVSEVLA